MLPPPPCPARRLARALQFPARTPFPRLRACRLHRSGSLRLTPGLIRPNAAPLQIEALGSLHYTLWDQAASGPPELTACANLTSFLRLVGWRRSGAEELTRGSRMGGANSSGVAELLNERRRILEVAQIYRVGRSRGDAAARGAVPRDRLLRLPEAYHRRTGECFPCCTCRAATASASFPPSRRTSGTHCCNTGRDMRPTAALVGCQSNPTPTSRTTAHICDTATAPSHYTYTSSPGAAVYSCTRAVSPR